jgi:PAS domain S-box-containing protein
MAQPPGLGHFLGDLRPQSSFLPDVCAAPDATSPGFASGAAGTVDPRTLFDGTLTCGSGDVHTAFYDALGSAALHSKSTAPLDVDDILSRIPTRPDIPFPVDPNSCSFVITDALAFDHPIIYASPGFERLTGYAASDVLGYNCRFLQFPDLASAVRRNSLKKRSDEEVVRRLHYHISEGSEVQICLSNYRKGGERFLNLLSIIPVREFVGI